MIPLIVLVVAAVVCGTAVAMASLRVPALDPASPRAVRPAARAIEKGIDRIDRGDRWRTFARRRVDPQVGTGLLLTIGLIMIVLLGVLVFQVRTDRGVVELDRSIERWADGVATSFSDDVISRITDLGGTLALVVAGLAVTVVDWLRNRTLRVVLLRFGAPVEAAERHQALAEEHVPRQVA